MKGAKKPKGYASSSKKKPDEIFPVVWTCRLPGPHVEFLEECFPVKSEEHGLALSNSVKLFLRQPRSPTGQIAPREIRGYTSRQSLRLKHEDWALLRKLARHYDSTPAEALTKAVESAARRQGYTLTIDRRKAIWG